MRECEVVCEVLSCFFLSFFLSNFFTFSFLLLLLKGSLFCLLVDVVVVVQLAAVLA